MRTTLLCGLLSASTLLCSCSSDDDSYEETFQINSHKAACTGLIETVCLMRRESATEEWSLHYEGIAGFNYEWGKMYEVRVRVTRVPNPLADASALNYSLVAILSSTDVPRSQTFQINVRNSAQAIVAVDSVTRRFAQSTTTFSCQPSVCSQLSQLAAQSAPATLTFDHSSSPTGPLNLISVL